jgi:23S rRNA G2445 N2-methylase RlmL
MKFLAYLTKGLKDIAKEEILEKVSEAEIERSSEKYLVFSAEESSIEHILDLRTVDDAHILLNFKQFEEKPDVEKAIENFPIEDITETRKLIEGFRSVDDVFSLTNSKYRNGSIDLELLEQNLSETLENSTEYDFVDNQHSNFDIRTHFEKKNMLVSVRLTEKPLYFRDYWQKGRKGSLKTSIAAALTAVARPSEKHKLVDNFCGAGTILCEAEVQGAEVSGGDIDREAVQCTRGNLKELDAEAANRVKKIDAASTSQPDDYFDIAVSNFPWGDQVDLNAVELYSEAIEEYARILKEDSRIVILGKHPDLAKKYLRKNFPDHDINRFQLGFLGQNPTVTYAAPEQTS